MPPCYNSSPSCTCIYLLSLPVLQCRQSTYRYIVPYCTILSYYHTSVLTLLYMYFEQLVKQPCKYQVVLFLPFHLEDMLDYGYISADGGKSSRRNWQKLSFCPKISTHVTPAPKSSSRAQITETAMFLLFVSGHVSTGPITVLQISTFFKE